jgi:hypothetical protein
LLRPLLHLRRLLLVRHVPTRHRVGLLPLVWSLPLVLLLLLLRLVLGSLRLLGLLHHLLHLGRAHDAPLLLR